MGDLSGSLGAREQLLSASVFPGNQVELVGSKMSSAVTLYNSSGVTANMEEPFAALTFHIRALLATTFGITIYALSLYGVLYLIPA